MGAKTKIEWTRGDDGSPGRTWNPVRGCSLVSDGCRRCYAMKQAHRFSGKGQPYEGLTETGPNGPRWNGKVRLVLEALEQPLHWKKPCRVFVNSMSDLFHKDVPADFIKQCFDVMEAAPQHTFQILTKRPERIEPVLFGEEGGWYLGGGDYLPNIHLGVSVEDQPTADDRIKKLLAVAWEGVNFVSYEPALAAVDFETGRGFLTGQSHDNAPYKGRYVNWLIVGGESGPRARPCNLQWIRSVIAQCKAANVLAFVKQFGSNPVHETGGAVGVPQLTRYPLRDRKGGDMSEWPKDLQVRQWPK